MNDRTGASDSCRHVVMARFYRTGSASLGKSQASLDLHSFAEQTCSFAIPADLGRSISLTSKLFFEVRNLIYRLQTLFSLYA